PYRIRPRHVLQIEAVNSPPRYPVGGRYVVDLDGWVDLGPLYGKVALAGLTLEEATSKVEDKLNQVLPNTEVAVTLGGWATLWQMLEDEEAPPVGKPSPETGGKKESLRYGGKTFNQWRTELMTELKPEIRIDGIKALREFGANGYGTEAVLAIVEV